MAEILSTLSSTGAEGSVANGGARYTSMTDWENAQQGDLTTTANPAGEPSTSVLTCYKGTTVNGGWDAQGHLFDNCTAQGWNSSAANNITIEAAPGSENNGVHNSGFKQYFNNTGAPLTVIDGSDLDMFVDVLNIEFENTDDGNGFNYGIDYRGSGGTIKNCMTRASYRSLGLTPSDKGSIVLINCVSGPTGPNRSPSAFFDDVSGIGDITYYNCTATTGCNIGFQLRSLGRFIYNCVAVGATGGDFTNNAGSTTGSNCASSDGTVVTLGIGTVTGVSTADGVDFVEPSTGNYQPASTGKLANAGIDESAIFLDDITGTLR